MTTANVYGGSVGRGQVRRWALEGLRLWVPDYLREAERVEGYTVGQAQNPRDYPVAPDLRKMPEQKLPCVVVQIPGLTERGARKVGGGEYFSEWVVALSGVVHGVSMEDTEALADVYGLALRLLMIQQAGAFTVTPGYAGPALQVEGVTYDDEGYDDLPWKRSRTLVAATVTFRVDIRGTAHAGGPLEPSPTPTTDPGDWPEVLTTELTVEHMDED